MFQTVSLLPLAAFFAIFAIYPFYELFRMSFSSLRLSNGSFIWSGAGMANFTRAVHDPLFWSSVERSVVFIICTTVATVVLGTALAFLTDRVVVMRQVARNVLLWPAVVAPVVISAMWLLILNPQIGLVNRALDGLGMQPQGWLGSGLGAFVAIVAVDVWHWTPLVYLLVYTALKGVDASVLEAAQVDGAREWQTIRHVLLPLLTPAIVAAAAVRVVMGVKVFDEMYLLTGGGPGTATTVISLDIRQVFFDQLHFGLGAAISVLIVLGVLVVGVLGVALRRAVRVS